MTTANPVDTARHLVEARLPAGKTLDNFDLRPCR